jgi:hypothetical protein
MAARGPDQVCAKQIRAHAETLVCRTPWAIFQYFRYIRNIFTAAEHRRLSSMMSGSARQRAAVPLPELPQERPKFRCERSPVAQRSSIKSLSPLRKYHSHLHQDALR